MLNNEHNPIAQLVNKIQQKWTREATPYPHIKLVRWLIKPDQADLYAGFLKLESTPHGSIKEVPVVLLSPFKNASTHSKTLIRDWVNAFEKDKEFHEALEANDIKFNWKYKEYKEKVEAPTTNANELLVEMLTAFQQALPDPKLPVVLSLYPYSVEDTEAYQFWMQSILELQLPDKVKLMIFDYAEVRHFEYIMQEYPDSSKSLAVPLDLEGAIGKLASSGNRGVEIMRKTGKKSNYSTAYIIYASMLLNFKKHDKIEQLGRKALNIAKSGHALGDSTCQSLIMQSYGLLGSNKQMQKKPVEASKLFCLQAEKAVEFGFGVQALTAWWLAYSAIRRKDKATYERIVEQAYRQGISLDAESLKASCMRYVAGDFYRISEKNNDEKQCQSIHEFMAELIGENWRIEVEANRKEMEKMKIPIPGLS